MLRMSVVETRVVGAGETNYTPLHLCLGKLLCWCVLHGMLVLCRFKHGRNALTIGFLSKSNFACLNSFSGCIVPGVRGKIALMSSPEKFLTFSENQVNADDEENL